MLDAQKAFLGMSSAVQEATLALGRFGIALQETQEQARLLRLGHRWSVGSQTGVDGVTARPTASERVGAAEADLGVLLLPWQREVAIRYLSGERMVLRSYRLAGRATIQRVIEHAETDREGGDRDD